MASLKAEKERGASEFHKHKELVETVLSSAKNGDILVLKNRVEKLQQEGVGSCYEIVRDFRDAHQRNAMHFAAAEGRRKIIQLILDYPKDHPSDPSPVAYLDEDHRTPLYYACQSNAYATCKLLLENKSDPNMVLKNGTSPLHEAAANGSVRMINLLLASGASIESASPNGTPLHFAISEGREKCFSALVEHGANVNAINAQGGWIY